VTSGAIAGGRILNRVGKLIAAVVPSIGILFLFWLALRAMIQADRRERAAEAKWDREHGLVGADGVADGTGAGEAPGEASRDAGGSGDATSTRGDGGASRG
jgi:hypothetical protein